MLACLTSVLGPVLESVTIDVTILSEDTRQQLTIQVLTRIGSGVTKSQLEDQIDSIYLHRPARPGGSFSSSDSRIAKLSHSSTPSTPYKASPSTHYCPARPPGLSPVFGHSATVICMSIGVFSDQKHHCNDRYSITVTAVTVTVTSPLHLLLSPSQPVQSLDRNLLITRIILSIETSP